MNEKDCFQICAVYTVYVGCIGEIEIFPVGVCINTDSYHRDVGRLHSTCCTVSGALLSVAHIYIGRLMMCMLLIRQKCFFFPCTTIFFTLS